MGQSEDAVPPSHSPVVSLSPPLPILRVLRASAFQKSYTPLIPAKSPPPGKPIDPMPHIP